MDPSLGVDQDDADLSRVAVKDREDRLRKAGQFFYEGGENVSKAKVSTLIHNAQRNLDLSFCSSQSTELSLFVSVSTQSAISQSLFRTLPSSGS
jgi:hypothetical protein